MMTRRPPAPNPSRRARGIAAIGLGVLACATACGGTNDVVTGSPSTGSIAGSTIGSTTGATATSAPTGVMGSTAPPVPDATATSGPPTTCVSAPATTTNFDKGGGRLLCGPAPTDPGRPATTYAGGGPVTTTTFAPDARNGVLQGRLAAGPACPVERPDQPCPDRPIGGTVTIRNLRLDSGIEPNFSIVRDVAAGESFGALLLPGDWEVVATSDQAMSCPTETVKVVAGQVSDITMACDTGIR